MRANGCGGVQCSAWSCSGHGCSEAAQVHGAWRVLVNAAVLPVQHRHHPGLVAGGSEHRRRTLAGAQRFGNGQVGVGVEGGQPGQFALDGQCRVGITPVPLRTVHAQQKAAGGGVVPKGGVLAVADEGERAGGQVVVRQRGEGDAAHATDLSGAAEHMFTVASVGVDDKGGGRRVSSAPRLRETPAPAPETCPAPAPLGPCGGRW